MPSALSNERPPSPVCVLRVEIWVLNGLCPSFRGKTPFRYGVAPDPAHCTFGAVLVLLDVPANAFTPQHTRASLCCVSASLRSRSELTFGMPKGSGGVELSVFGPFLLAFHPSVNLWSKCELRGTG